MPIQLNRQERNQIQMDAMQNDVLSEEQIEQIASKLNKKVNIPFLSEKKEQIILVKIVRKIDDFFYANLPNEIYELVVDAHDGLDDSEVEVIKERLAKKINNYIDIPYVPESMEEEILEFLFDAFVDALKKNKSL